MKKFWLQYDECTGCGMCANVCPVNAIEMTTDTDGFDHPIVKNNCIDCNKCQNKCEYRYKLESINNSMNPATYAAWSKSEEVRFESTSGGAFSEFAISILKDNGYVIGAAYDKENTIQHTIVSSIDELYKIRQSKYAQSSCGNIYREIRESLNIGKKVLFCGAPCQVAALLSFLYPNSYENLYTIDFICRGVNSPKALKAWTSEIEKEQNTKITRIWFKYKEGGWKSSPRRTRLEFDDGHNLVLENEKNLFMHGYLTSNLYIRPSCGECKFKGLPRKADITLGDFWGISKEFDDDKGTSLILVNNAHGDSLFDKVKNNFVLHERDFKEVLNGNACFYNSVSVPDKSHDFLADLSILPFSYALKKYTPNTKSSIVKKCVNRINNYIKKVVKVHSEN